MAYLVDDEHAQHDSRHHTKVRCATERHGQARSFAA